ncbi:elongation factor Tu [Streptomyces sp. SCA3-4]|uniref:EF-Tu C-terminal domain-related protein n=1 Tax=Streptomyces sichuanensis TaxID=2871810 RepID=UPI001CE3A8B0|nr:EF-Tu/IF-2/RF-3 family GTPase [Streptomyces sichuanensis]MCA6091886.1 elongation factor Tu [Streptomyces sichuanensis]
MDESMIRSGREVEYVGAPGSGTTTLTGAIARATGHVPTARHFTALDWPPGTSGAEKLTRGHRRRAVVLVVSATDGPTPATAELLRLVRAVGVEHVAVFVNKADLLPDPELQQVLALEIRELLRRHAYPAEVVPIVFGSARQPSAVEELLTVMSGFPAAPRERDMPFLMPVEDVFPLSGRRPRTVLTGRIERGVLRVGDEVEYVGLSTSGTATVTAIERFRGERTEWAEAGENIGVELRGVTREDVERGQVLAVPGTATAHSAFEAEVYVLPEDDGGRDVTFARRQAQFYFRTTDVAGQIVVLRQDGQDIDVSRGGPAFMSVRLAEQVAVEKGTRFSIREAGKAVGGGVVTAILR